MRLIDAEPIERDLFKEADKTLGCNPYEKARICAYRRVLERVLAAPTITLHPATPLPNDPLTLDQLREMDGEPAQVVRCKDCKHLYFKDFSGFCPHRVSACSPDGFCEYGERRKPEEGMFEEELNEQ